MLLIPDGKRPEDYSDWAEKIGLRSALGVELNVLISYSADRKPDWQISGIVGVPRPPEDDLERQLLATKLAETVEPPTFAVFKQIGLVRWADRTGGPFTVDVIESRAIRTVRESDVSTTLEYSGPGPLGDPVFRRRFDDEEKWSREYAENRYLRFESRPELHQRYQDLLTNINILTDIGAVDLTDEEQWHRLFRDVVDEMFLRGQPPVPHNRDPFVEEAVLFPDRELCRRAANAASNRGICRNRLVKYGGADDIRNLYERGQVYMNSASFYDQPGRHNQAVYDKERVAIYKGAIVGKPGRAMYVRQEEFLADPLMIKDPDRPFVPLFEASDATESEVVGLEFGTKSDFWLYCMSRSLIPRLFSDFEAEACVVLDARKFIARIAKEWKTSVSESADLSFGPVRYTDPLGAYATSEIDSELQNFFTKTFRYAYQNEFRFVGLPRRHRENLAHVELELGALDDIGELIVL